MHRGAWQATVYRVAQNHHDRSDLTRTQSLSAVILEPNEIKFVIVFTSPPLFAQSDGTRCLDLHFLNVEF